MKNCHAIQFGSLEAWIEVKNNICSIKASGVITATSVAMAEDYIEKNLPRFGVVITDYTVALFACGQNDSWDRANQVGYGAIIVRPDQVQYARPIAAKLSSQGAVRQIFTDADEALEWAWQLAGSVEDSPPERQRQEAPVPA